MRLRVENRRGRSFLFEDILSMEYALEVLVLGIPESSTYVKSTYCSICTKRLTHWHRRDFC